MKEIARDVAQTVRQWATSPRLLAAGIAVGTLLSAGACQSLLSALSTRAEYKPKSHKTVQMQGSQRLWAGDMNFHISPPDDPKRIRRSFNESVEMLSKSELDFVFITPQIPARFWDSVEQFERVRRDWQSLQATMSSMSDKLPLMMVGAEYVDDKNGSATIIGVDLPKALNEVSRDDLRANPTAFINLLWMRGALVFLNTPLATPLKAPVDSPQRYSSIDRSWKPLTKPSAGYPKDILAIHNLYDGMEAYNVQISVWRDQYVQGDPTASLAAVMSRLDLEIIRKKRRLIPIGGSNSRGRSLRPTIYIAAPERTPEALRQGLTNGRVCVRSPLPCGLRVFADAQPVAAGVGDHIVAQQHIDIRWEGGEGELFRNAESLGTFDGRTLQATSRSECHIYRLVVDGGFSAPFFVNCPQLAAARP
ncbi:MAG: hypothetical protein KAY55_06170 [Deltaproteobacteria bacterium]|nr:hypothetical protein [Deltaproteobacteria bacterium]